MKIIRTNKPAPKVIKRTPKKPVPEVLREGTGWPVHRGIPQSSNKAAHHAIEVEGKIHVFLWEPDSPLEAMWSCGLYRCSASVMGRHNYRGEVSVVYRLSPSEPAPIQPQQFWKKRR
jgi:hypothetical protein